MKKTLLAAGLAVVLGACSSSKNGGEDRMNPFFTEYATPFGVPPFEQIHASHYKPALLKGMEEQMAEIQAIVNNQEEANFENTICGARPERSFADKGALCFQRAVKCEYE